MSSANKKTKAVYREASEMERARALALRKCTLPVASMTKRFVRTVAAQMMAVPPMITHKQAVYIDVCAYRFRRQMPAELVPAEPPPEYQTLKQRDAEMVEQYRAAQIRSEPVPREV